MDVPFEDLIKKIREKKELSGIDSSLISGLIEGYLLKQRILLERLKPSETKILVKDVRAELRNYVGRFQTRQKQRSKLLKVKDFNALLETHSSTKERLGFYPELRKLLSELKVKSVLDLACGLNPLALANMEIKYYASDINREDLDVVEAFFKDKRINGKTFVCNLTKIKEYALPEADLCALFKVLDILEKRVRGISEKIILSLSCKYILVSFSTRKLSGKPMNHPQREWFERLTKRLNLSFKILESDNEIFYLIKKS